MKHVRLTAELDPERTPAFVDLLANAPAISEARVIDWNLAAEEGSMLLLAVDGDASPLEAEADAFTGVERVDVSERGAGPAHALVHVRRAAIPVFTCLASALDRGGLLIRKPVVFRDGEIRTRIVGDPGPLQAALERQGDALTVRVDEISSNPGASERPGAALSDRQREALSVALSLGYFGQPRGATHEDIADELGCAPATASDHLQKAEAKLVQAAMDDFGPRV